MTTIGIIGCGLMGKGITRNYLKKGYKVLVFDTNPEAIAWIKDQGATAVGALWELAQEAPVLISSLPSVEAVNETFLGEQGVFNRAREGSVIIDMSTTDVETAIHLAEEAADKGLHFFDCPVSGGPDGAEKGTLTLMVGGDEEKFSEIRPVLNVVGENIYYLGQSGNGQIAKLCNNMVVAAAVASFGEAFSTAEKAGLSREKLAEVLSTGSASKVFSVFGGRIVSETYEDVAFSLNHMHKDLSLYMQTASSVSSPSFLGAETFRLFETAKSNGKGGKDTTAVCELYKEITARQEAEENSD